MQQWHSSARLKCGSRRPPSVSCYDRPVFPDLDHAFWGDLVVTRINIILVGWGLRRVNCCCIVTFSSFFPCFEKNDGQHFDSIFQGRENENNKLIVDLTLVDFLTPFSVI